MRHTTLSPSDLNLELFVIASGEAVPINYNLKKIYCNTFDHKNVDRWDGVSPDRSLGFVGRQGWAYSEIGHPEAKKLMWDGCVVTRFEGRFSSREMKEDIFFELQYPEPYRAVAYSYQGARLYALKDPAYVFSIGLLILTIYYSIRLSGVPISSRLKRLAIPFLVFSIVCIVVYVYSFLNIGEKKKVRVLGHTRSEWNIAASWLGGSLYDLKDSDLKMSDAELVDFISKELPELFNPYTREPFIIEDSPGNITVEREEGLITGIIFYHRNGSPYRIL
jgi:hypothetical protein